MRSRIACLSSAPWNPYLRLLYGALAGAGLDVVWDGRLRAGWLWRSRRTVRWLHVHWPEGLYRFERGPRRLRPLLSWAKLALLALRLSLARLLGYRIVWTVHQVYPHESSSRRLDRAASAVLARFSSVLIAHDPATAETVRRELGREPLVVPHGSYVGVYPPGRDRDEVLRDLDLPDGAFVFLSFGELRRYKGVDVLLDAFAGLQGDDVALVVAGNAKDPGVAALLDEAHRADERIRLRLRFVAEDEVAELYEAADAVVVPRADGGTSGSLILALSLGRPVIAADTPTYRALTDGGAGWLYAPGDAESLRAALAEAAANPREARRRGRAARRRAEQLDWQDIGRRTAVALRG